MSSSANSFARSINRSQKLHLVINRENGAKETAKTAHASHPYRCMCGDKTVTCSVHSMRELLPEAHH